VIRALPAALLCAVALAACGGGDKTPPTDGSTTKRPPVIGRPGGEPEAAQSLGFPDFATKNTTRIGGADPIADAAAVARAVYPATSADTRPAAVVVVDVDDWRSALSAAQLSGPPLRAPILFSRKGELSEATEQAIEDLDPKGAKEAGDAQVIRVGIDAAPVEGYKTTDIPGSDYTAIAREIDKLQSDAMDDRSDAVIVAPGDGPSFAMPGAGYAAKSGVPLLWTGADRLPSATREAIEKRKQPRIYVLGPSSAIPDRVLEELRALGPVRRVFGSDAIRNAIAFARFADGKFGWNVVDPGHGLVFASAERTADAAAAAPLSASGKYGPLLLVSDAQQLPGPLESYLLDIQPGYQADPVRGVYNHAWLMGDEAAISVPVQSRIDALLEIQPVDADTE
jgi:hypothetical protein